MRQSEARDVRSFLEEPVEEIVVETDKVHNTKAQPDKWGAASVRAQFVGVPFINPWDGTNAPSESVNASSNASSKDTDTSWDGINTPWNGISTSLQNPDIQLQEVGVQFITPWRGT